MIITDMAAFPAALEVPFDIIPSEIGPLIFEERKEKIHVHYVHVCAAVPLTIGLMNKDAIK